MSTLAKTNEGDDDTRVHPAPPSGVDGPEGGAGSPNWMHPLHMSEFDTLENNFDFRADPRTQDWIHENDGSREPQ